jgi:inhibitor of KinA sporulation pathway (predicted exonuclease)
MIELPKDDFVIADLEYTSWEGALARGWDRPGKFREIVQIGAVRVSRAVGLQETDALSLLVRPTLNPELSDYFTNLTGITNADIARAGVPLDEALNRFAAFVGELPILTHGRDDLVVAEE